LFEPLEATEPRAQLDLVAVAATPRDSQPDDDRAQRTAPVRVAHAHEPPTASTLPEHGAAPDVGGGTPPSSRRSYVTKQIVSLDRREPRSTSPALEHSQVFTTAGLRAQEPPFAQVAPMPRQLAVLQPAPVPRPPGAAIPQPADRVTKRELPLDPRPEQRLTVNRQASVLQRAVGPLTPPVEAKQAFATGGTLAPARAPLAPGMIARMQSQAPPPRAQTSQVTAQAPVHITIGRVEVRANVAAGDARSTRRPIAPSLSLDDYLSGRNGHSR
jgi:hypothetical protein